MDLKDAVCIVTGSATGVGAACAIGLARKGARVVVNFTRSEQAARDTAEACRSAGGEAVLAQGDVSSDGDCRRIAQVALDRWGKIDGLINNAGITKFAAADDLHALSADDWHALYAVNVLGPFQMIRACEPAMRAAGRGSVVNVSSTSGITGLGSSTAYAATKGALNTLTLSLARALAPTIRVNAVAPGLVDTRWHADRYEDPAAYDKFLEAYRNKVPLGTIAQGDDIAEVAVWLLEGARHVTGEIVVADGGVHLGKSPASLTARKP